MNKVTVIMSTFNGEKYVEEQIKSIFLQNDVLVSLFIRDDGSTDGTINIIKKLQKKYPIKFVIGGKNLKPAYSFLEALKICDFQTDYYSYADQDDVWFPDKLKRACQKLKNYSASIPSLYCSSYDVVDENLNLIFTRDLGVYGDLTLQTTLVGVTPSGCTMVFNKSLMDILKDSNPRYMRMHDFWTLLTAQAYDGNVVIDNIPTMSYRQHGNNTVGFSNRFELRHWIRLIKNVRNHNERYRQAISVMENYETSMSDINLRKLKKLLEYPTSFSNKIKLLKDNSFKTTITRINFLFRISVLLGIY
ncbi:glycosyltransferase family 2 protein [Enterococcus dongliensis]|uniref:glycosyltransferase family 2 protein n=1 Tax=Enterococcus dongliensis TaxID=2559925 RepID=UPI00289168A1|nr:glycosyltransferase family 2 protein [Enterococcus dongliensis]MDT2634766.1 glycosyltransferase family 2 protein [Enterococcus dongliensis]MDT2669253.1 glycosyltransferase family 2 protein [Enterococcus dongliensis]